MVDKTLKAIELVSAAIQGKKVAEEGETEVTTTAFYMKLKRSRKNVFNRTEYTIKSKDRSKVRVNLPSPAVVVENLKDDTTIDVQVNTMHPLI